MDGDKKEEKCRDLIPIRRSPRFTPQKDDKKDTKASEFPGTKSPNHERKAEEKAEGKSRKALDFDEEQKEVVDKKQKQVLVEAGSSTVPVRRTRGAGDAYAQTTKVLRMFAATVERAYGNDSRALMYLMDDAVYGMPAKAYVSKGDCDTFLQMGWAENCHIETYSA